MTLPLDVVISYLPEVFRASILLLEVVRLKSPLNSSATMRPFEVLMDPEPAILRTETLPLELLTSNSARLGMESEMCAPLLKGSHPKSDRLPAGRASTRIVSPPWRTL